MTDWMKFFNRDWMRHYRDALYLVNEIRCRRFPLYHLASDYETEGLMILACVAIYLKTGKRATREQRQHLI